MPMPSPGQAPAQDPQQQQAPHQGGQESPAAQMASQANDGLMGLIQLAQQAGQKDTVQILTQVYNGFKSAMEHLGKPAGQGSPEPQAPGGPIQAGAAPDSQPYPYQ